MNRHLKKVSNDQRLRYIIAGGSSFVVEYSLFILFEYVDINIFVANSLSFLAGLTISFLIHRYWSFKGEHHFKAHEQAAGYITLAMINLVLTNGAIGILLLLGVKAIVAKGLSFAAMVLWNYLILNKLIFRKKPLKN